MSLTYERGNPEEPRGHAVVYYRDSSDPEKVAATYLIVLPVSVDFSKYVPPFLAGQVPNIGDADLTTFAFPPSPEPAESYAQILAMAEARDDDLIFGGAMQLAEVMGLMTSVGEIVEEYAESYNAHAGPPVGETDSADQLVEGSSDAADTGVDDVVYSMMSEADQLGELTKLVGRLRFAAEGSDDATADDAAARVRALGRHMPANRQVEQLLESALSPSQDGAKLAQLYLERAYSLLREDYLRVKSIDEEIEATEAASD